MGKRRAPTSSAKSKVAEMMSPKKKKLLKSNAMTMSAKIESLRKQNEKLQSELGKEAADLAQNAMNAMESHILSGSPLPDKQTKKRVVKKKKDKVPINSKYCQELYDKEMKSKKRNGFIHPKFEDLTANKMKKEKQNEEKREKRRKERRAEIKVDLEEKKKQKQIVEEKKAKKEEERKKLREIKQKERAKKESEEKQAKKRELEKFKAEKQKKREQELKQQRAKE